MMFFNFMYFTQSLEACLVGLLLGYVTWTAAEWERDNVRD